MKSSNPISLASFVILEELSEDVLANKLDLYLNGSDKESFYALMRDAIETIVIDNQKVMELITRHNIDYRRLVDFLVDNVDGQESIDYQYSMMKVIQLLKGDKNLKWDKI